MLNVHVPGNNNEKISGLALALLSDLCFNDLCDLSGENNKPLRRFKPKQPLLAKKRNHGFSGEVFLRRR